MVRGPTGASKPQSFGCCWWFRDPWRELCPDSRNREVKVGGEEARVTGLLGMLPEACHELAFGAGTKARRTNLGDGRPELGGPVWPQRHLETLLCRGKSPSTRWACSW